MADEPVQIPGLTESQQEFFDLLQKQEPLHPDLALYLETSKGLGWPILRHPLVFSIPHHEGMNALVNIQYAQKKAAVDKAFEEHNWNRFIYLHERPYRVWAFKQIFAEFYPIGDVDTDSAYWKILSGIWQDSENIHVYRGDWRRFWRLKRPQKHLVMDEEEQAELAAMPNHFTIWRGVALRKGVTGMSWTLDRDKAIWFARRHVSEGDGDVAFLAQATIEKRFVQAYFTGRAEKEIVVFPERCREVTVTVERKRARS